MTDYGLLIEQAIELTRDIPYETANLANLSALIFGALEEVNWAGFYELKGDKLVLSCFQGKPACVILPLSRGVCAEAARTGSVVNVPDVQAFSGHIACDSASASEIVLPLNDPSGKVKYVLDIDSPVRSRFTAEDEAGLTKLARAIERILFPAG